MDRRAFGHAMLATAVGSFIEKGQAHAEPSSVTVSASSRLSVMLWTILPNEPFARRIAVVAEAGYHAVELVNEFDHWSAEDFENFRRTRDALAISVDAIGLGAPGISNPAMSGRFLQKLRGRIATALALGCRDIIVLSGSRLPHLSKSAQWHASIDILKRGGELAGEHGCRLLLESLDPEEEPEFFLNSVTEMFDIVRAVGSPHVKALYDFYHEQISSGNLIDKLTKNLELIGLVHIADVPGRHEPGTGEINYRNIIRRLAELGYEGRIAMEFLPSGDPVQTLRAARELVEAEINREPRATSSLQRRLLIRSSPVGETLTA